MAAIFNHTDFWHMSSDDAANEMIKNHQKRFVTYSWVQGFIACLMNPLIVSGNAFVVYAVWKDPLKNLRCSPSNFILQSMAIADLLVGMVVSPIHAFWLFSIAVAQKPPLISLHVIYSISAVLVGASLAHVTLLSLDRLIAVVKPLSYRSIMTRRRINLGIFVIWLYFICFGIAAFVLKNSAFILGVVFSVQMTILLESSFYIYCAIIFHLRKNNREWERRILQGHVRVTHQERHAASEGRLAKAMAFVVFISLFFITPFYVMQCLVYFCVPCYSHPEMLFVFSGVQATLSYLNSLGNPILCCWRVSKYKEALKYCFKRVVGRCTVAKARYREREIFDTKL